MAKPTKETKETKNEPEKAIAPSVDDAAPTAELPAVVSDESAPGEEQTPLQIINGSDFAESYQRARELTAQNAYEDLRKELEGQGDFPAWDALGERARNLYLEAVDACLGENHQPRTRFEEIVLARMARTHEE